MKIRISKKRSGRTGKAFQSIYYDTQSNGQMTIKEIKTWPFKDLSFVKGPTIDEAFFNKSIAKLKGSN